MAMPIERTGNSANWGHEETILLLKLWGQPEIQQEMLTTIRNLDIYNFVAQEMHRQMPQCRRTGLQCRYRIKRLKRDFIRAKNEGDKRLFAFYEQMDAGLTERAKAAESARLAKDGEGGKKRKRSKKKKKEKPEGSGLAAAAPWPVMMDASEIKIEIDNAEEYEYGISKHGGQHPGSAGHGDRDKDSSDDEDDDDDSHQDLSSSAAESREARADEEEEDSSLPIRFYDAENNCVVGPGDLSAVEQPIKSASKQSSNAADAENSSKTAATVTEDAASSSDPRATSPDSSSFPFVMKSASPFPFFIKSVYHVKDVDQVDAGDKDESGAQKRTGDKDSDHAGNAPADDSKPEDDPSASPSKPIILRHRSAEDRAAAKASESGEIPSTDSALTGSNKNASGVGGLSKVASQVDKDLQIIAEWTIKEGETLFEGDSAEETASKTSEVKDSAGGKESLSVVTPPASATGTVSADSAKEKERSPQVSPSPSSSLVSSSTSSSSPSSQFASVKVKTGARYKIIESAGIRTLVRIPDSELGPLHSKASSVPTTASSSLKTMSTTTPSVRVLSSSSVSAAPPTVPKSAMSLLSSAQKLGRAPPRVILFEGSGRQLHGATSSSNISNMTFTTSAGRLATTDLLTGRKVVVAPSSTTVTPVRVFKASQGTSLLSSSHQAGGKVFHLKPASPAAITTTTASSAKPVPVGAVPVSKPLTFTTLSSLDPTPKRVTISPEPPTPSATPPTSKTTIIIPRQVTPPASHGDVHVVAPREATQKELKRKLESRQAEEEDSSKRAATVSEERRTSVRVKQPHENLQEPSVKTEEMKTEKTDTSVVPKAVKLTDSTREEGIVIRPPRKVRCASPREMTAPTSPISGSRVVKVGPTTRSSKPVEPSAKLIGKAEEGNQHSPKGKTPQTGSTVSSPGFTAQESPRYVTVVTEAVGDRQGVERKRKRSTGSSSQITEGPPPAKKQTEDSSTPSAAAMSTTSTRATELVSPTYPNVIKITSNKAGQETIVSAEAGATVVANIVETEDGTEKEGGTERKAAVKMKSRREEDKNRITVSLKPGRVSKEHAKHRDPAISHSQPELCHLQLAQETLSPHAPTSPSSSRMTIPSHAIESEDALFRHFLSLTDLSTECKEWMMLALQTRTATAAAVASSSEESIERARHEPNRGSDVEVTNLVVNDGSARTDKQTGTFKVKAGLAQMAKGGIIMDVTTPEEARVAEEAGACAVMALERVPADIRRQGGVARMTDPKKIKEIMEAVTIPVMAKCRIGHFAEAQILESLGVDMVDESEVLTPADEDHHVDKQTFKVPFVCGARDLGEALRRISEGAAMIRTKGEAGTGDVVEAVRHARTINRQIRTAQALDHTELYNYAKELQVPYDLLKKTAELGRLPVVNFAAGGLATPADVSLLMQLGVDGVFVGSGIFKSSDPPSRARAMAQAVTHYKDPKILASLSENLGEAMFGTPVNQQMRKAASAPGNKEQEKLWNATLAMEKFKVTS